MEVSGDLRSRYSGELREGQKWLRTKRVMLTIAEGKLKLVKIHHVFRWRKGKGKVEHDERRRRENNQF
jgi:hypothetical protein